MTDAQRLKDITTETEFTTKLSDAEAKANNAWEEEFLSNLRTAFDKYKGEMFLSDRQMETLNKIFNRESE